MKYGLLTAFSLILLSSCSSDDKNIPDLSDLNGKWVEIGTRSDTLIFTSTDDLNIMTLKRGTEVRNGQPLPKSGSGPYEYRLEEAGRISIYWMLSSNYEFKEYGFRYIGNTIIVDNFFDPALPKKLSFEKLP